jgi:ABC-2 type transport system ATP-binding protein
MGPSGDLVIQTVGLSKRFGGTRRPVGRTRAVDALVDLDVEVQRGEIFGFLGPNGAGKTTAIRLLLGFLHATRGSATVLGLDIARDARAIRARVGYLPGGIALYDTMRGDDLLDYLCRLYRRPPTRRAGIAERLELPAALLRRPVRDYSRGTRQKLGVIQALQHDPELAILDEPTEGLDPLMQRAFYDLLDELKREGRTIFLSSHILSEVERVCDRVAIIREGRLVALQDVGALLASRKRHVELRFHGPAPTLEGIAGVSGVHASEGFLSCQLQGDPRPFLAAIGGVALADLTIEPAHLEEAFLEFYAERPA